MQCDSSNAILRPSEMVSADKDTVAQGLPGLELMERAGQAVTDVILTHYEPQLTLVCCGPGNNGGDGWVIARLLRNAGWEVRVATKRGELDNQSDAAMMADRYEGKVIPLATAVIEMERFSLVIDAIFGTGLNRDIEGEYAALFDAIAQYRKPVVSVDIPSGIHGDSGQICGHALQAEHTVTFCRPKPGHLLLPGYRHSGELHIEDIGISDEVVDAQTPSLYSNSPGLWHQQFPRMDVTDHKYRRGHTLIFGGPAHRSGAAMLASEAALRVGSGLVTQIVPDDSLVIYAAASKKAVMTCPYSLSDNLMIDSRVSACLIGPGYGVGERTRAIVTKLRSNTSLPLILDADGLTSFESCPEKLFGIVDESCLLTPHEGEFARLFPDISYAAKWERAQAAAQRTGCTIILKGADTVIASPEGAVVLHSISAPQLATAGSGDVLAGICTGLIAQGMPAFEAACAAVWIHGQAGLSLGRGMIADDLLDEIPYILELCENE